MRKKLLLIAAGCLGFAIAYAFGAVGWVYVPCCVAVLFGLAWMGVYDAQPSRDSYEKWGDSSRYGGGEGGGC